LIPPSSLKEYQKSSTGWLPLRMMRQGKIFADRFFHSQKPLVTEAREKRTIHKKGKKVDSLQKIKPF